MTTEVMIITFPVPPPMTTIRKLSTLGKLFYLANSKIVDVMPASVLLGTTLKLNFTLLQISHHTKY